MSDIWKVGEMGAWLAVVDEHRVARSAHIPNLVEIRQLELLENEAGQRWLDALDEDWDELCSIHTCGCRRTTTLMVHENEHPHESPPRGLCSPVKTAETRQFEAMVQGVFPDARQATTEWRDNG